jgi:hypothetical protein
MVVIPAWVSEVTYASVVVSVIIYIFMDFFKIKLICFYLH